jgi:hypothetical protein
MTLDKREIGDVRYELIFLLNLSFQPHSISLHVTTPTPKISLSPDCGNFSQHPKIYQHFTGFDSKRLRF